MAKIKGGLALDLQFIPMDGEIFARFTVGSPEPQQWPKVFRAFKEAISLEYRTVIAKDPQWMWEVGPVEGHVGKALADIFENFGPMLAGWRDSPMLPGMEFIKG